MPREMVLYYDPQPGERAAAVKQVFAVMGARIRNIAAEQTGQTIGFLLGRKGYDACQSTDAPAIAEPMLIFDGFNDKRLEIALREMKKAGASVNYKAIVTETNCAWLLIQLYEELCAEHAAMSGS